MADYSPDSFFQQIFDDDQASPENISFGLNQNASGFDASGYSQFQQQSLINQPSSTTDCQLNCAIYFIVSDFS